MAVLGAMSYMEAIGLSKDQAVTYLSKEPITIPAYQIQRGLAPEQAKHFREARDWYYKAALHGRLLALSHVGSIVAYLEVGPKGRERFENEGWEGVQDLLNRAIYLSDVHAAMPQQIAPQLCGGALNFCVMPGSDEQIAMTTDLVRQFEQDRQDAGLPPVGIPESTAPTAEELKSMICESYLDSNGNIAW